MFTAPAWLVSQFYNLTHNYALAIGLVALAVMILVTPLTLKSTKGMLEMQRLQPEMKRLQNQYRGDRQKLNEEMMKLYQEHKVNPLASCLPLLIQMPVFFIMYRVLRGLSRTTDGAKFYTAHCTNGKVADFCSSFATHGGNVPGKQVFDPDHISKTSDLYRSLAGKQEMLSFGLDLSKSPAHFISESVGKGLIYATLVVVLGLLYFAQQKMVASRAAVSPTMSATQAKLMQYLPVVFAVFQIFFLTGLVIYYITQALFRIGQNFYITKKFYGHEHSLGRQAQAASARARDEAKANGADTGGGMFAQAKRDAQARRDAIAQKSTGGSSGRPANARTNGSRPNSSGRPAPAGKTNQQPNRNQNKDQNQDSTGKNGGGKTPAPSSSSAPEPSTSKRVTPPKNRPTPTSSRPQRPSASGRPGAPARPKPPKK